MEQVASELLNRVVFFSRYEASLVGAEQIQWPHLFLGLMREARSLIKNFLGSYESVAGLRRKIEESLPVRPHVSTSVDIPMAADCISLIQVSDRETLGWTRREAPLEVLFVSMLKTQPDWLRPYGLNSDIAASALRYPAVNPPIPSTVPVSGMPAVMLEFRGVLDEMEAALRPMPEDRANEPIARDAAAWSRKQLIGLLIDSASNQHQLCVRALVSRELEVVFPDYDPAAWIDATGYQETPWRMLMDLCLTYHRLLYDLSNRVAAQKRSTVVCRVGSRAPRLLEDLLSEYVADLIRSIREFPG